VMVRGDADASTEISSRPVIDPIELKTSSLTG
jgi:hypothetical protein